MSALFKILDRVGSLLLEKSGMKRVPANGISERFRNARLFADGSDIVTGEGELFYQKLEALGRTIKWKDDRAKEKEAKGLDASFQNREVAHLKEILEAGELFYNGQQKLFKLLMRAHNEEVGKMLDMIVQLESNIASLQKLHGIASESEKTFLELLISSHEQKHT